MELELTKDGLHFTEMQGSVISANIQDSIVSSIEDASGKTKEQKKKVIVKVEATHSILTKNKTFYPANELEKAHRTWVEPYERPVIRNHNEYDEPLGRVKEAIFKDSVLHPGQKTIELTLEIVDSDAIEKVLDGRYKTVSIGGSASRVVCSVCGKDLVKEGYCGHRRGQTYEGKEAHWILGDIEYHEVSFVNVPADEYAQVINVNVVDYTRKGVSTMCENEIKQEVTPQENHVGASKEEDVLAIVDNVLDLASENTQDDTNETGQAKDNQNTVISSDQSEENDVKEEENVADKLQQLTLENATLLAEKEQLSEKLEKVEKEVEQLKEEKATIENEKQVLLEEKQQLLDQNTKLASYVHKVLAESVAYMKKMVGEIEDSQFEESLVELSKKSSRDLKEMMVGLADKKVTRIINHVHLNDGEEVEESASAQKKDEANIEKLASMLEKIFIKK